MNWKYYCPHCLHYDNSTGACSKLYFNLSSNPITFIKKCAGQFYEIDRDKEKELLEKKSNNNEINTIDIDMVGKIIVQCHNCGKKYRIANPLKPKRYRCKNCNNTVEVIPQYPVLEEEVESQLTIKKNPPKNYCPKCRYFLKNSIWCSKFNFKIKDNISKYYQDCNGKYFTPKIVEKEITYENQNKVDPPFYYVPKGRFFLYTLITGGFYQFFWFYKNWKLIRDINDLRISPFWRAFFAPIFCFSFFKRVKDHAINYNINTNLIPILLGAGYWILNGSYARIPSPVDNIFLIFLILLLFPVLTLIKKINIKINAKDIKTSKGEITFLIIFTLLNIFIIYMGINDLSAQ